MDVVSGAQSRRGSYRAPDEAEPSPPQISGLSVDEDRPIRRRGSQLYVTSKISGFCGFQRFYIDVYPCVRPDIAALQQRTSAMAGLSPRGDSSSDTQSSAAPPPSAAAIAAARQMSVDAEAIKIVIHDVDDHTPRRVSLRRDPNDKGHRCKYTRFFARQLAHAYDKKYKGRLKSTN